MCVCVHTHTHTHTHTYISLHNMEYYLAIKRNKVLILPIAWKNLENIILSKRSQL